MRRSRSLAPRISEKEPLTDAESKTLFRNLVTGQVMPDLSYAFHKFSFQTVFYMTNYHYCCCPCAYEHEYLEYLSNDRKIKQEIYERVETSIVRGRCLHVDKAPTLSITETAIYGSHIATVLGTNKVVLPYGRKSGPFLQRSYSVKEDGGHFCRYSNETEARGAIFRLGPFETALVKKRVTIDEYVKKHLSKGKLLHASRDIGNNTLLLIRPLLHIEIYLQNTSAKLLQELIAEANFKDIPELLKLAVKRHLTDLRNNLLQSVSSKNVSEHIFQSMTKTVIVYDQPEVLDTILKRIKLHDTNLTLYCSALKRKRCENVLKKRQTFVITKARPNNVHRRFTMLIDLLYEYHDDLKDEVWRLIDDYENIHWPMNQSSFKQYIKCAEEGFPPPPVLNSLLEQFLHASSIFCQRTAIKYQRVFRDTLEMLIYLNCSLNPLTSAVYLAIQRDADYHNVSVEFCRLPFRSHQGVNGISLQAGSYKMDAKEHALFWPERDNIALNFAGPLLIEAGYPFTNNGLEKAAHRRQLHPAEHDYLRKCIETPRSLKTTCCHVLRRYYTGRRIHQYVTHANITKPIQDFILLKPLLKSLNRWESARL